MISRIIVSALLLLNVWTNNPRGSSIQNAEITTIRLTQIIPNFLSGDGKGFDTSNSYIFYYNDLVLYKLPYQFDSSETVTIEGSAKSKILKSEIRYQYFALEKEKDFGLFYGKNFLPGVEKMPLDSFYKNEGSNFRNCMYQNIVENGTKIISHIDEKTSDGTSEIFKYLCKTDTSQTVTSRFYFSNKYSDIQFSLSPELDSIKQMKLYKVVAELESPCFKDFGIDPFRIIFSMEKANHQFDDEAMEYFKKYQKDIHTNFKKTDL